MIAAAKRSEQARLLSFVRLADYLIIDGLRMALTSTLEEILYVIRNVNATKEQEDALLDLDPLTEKETIDNEKNSNIEEPEEDLSDFIPIVEDLLPSTQYFIVELFIRNEILTFDPSYQNFETKVMKCTSTHQCKYNVSIIKSIKFYFKRN